VQKNNEFNIFGDFLKNLAGHCFMLFFLIRIVACESIEQNFWI
jgi:hypothetical protein